MPMTEPRAAVIGYGYAGHSFHSYLIDITTGLTLHGVASSDPAKRQQSGDGVHDKARDCAKNRKGNFHHMCDEIVRTM